MSQNTYLLINEREYKKHRSKIKRYRKKIKNMAKKCNRRIVYLSCLNIDWKGAPQSSTIQDICGNNSCPDAMSHNKFLEPTIFTSVYFSIKINQSEQSQMENYRKLKMINSSTQIPELKPFGREALCTTQIRPINIQSNKDHGQVLRASDKNKQYRK